MSEKYLPGEEAEDELLSSEFLESEPLPNGLDDDDADDSAEQGTETLMSNKAGDDLTPVVEDSADGVIAVDALLDAIPSSDGDPSGIDALSHRLAELNSVLAVSDDEIDEDDDHDVDVSSDSTPHLELETTNYDIGAISLEDPVRMYLREIGRVPLLNAQREVELASAMERGEYLKSKGTQLTSDFGEAPDADVLGRAIYHSVPVFASLMAAKCSLGRAPLSIASRAGTYCFSVTRYTEIGVLVVKVTVIRRSSGSGATLIALYL
jgi:hypothetical protein